MLDTIRAKTGQLQSNKHSKKPNMSSVVVSLNDFQSHLVLSESQNITADKHLKICINFTSISSQVSSDFSIVNICYLKFIRKFSHSFRETGHRENRLDVCPFSICPLRNALLLLSK